jgi:hypothetical protein
MTDTDPLWLSFSNCVKAATHIEVLTTELEELLTTKDGSAGFSLDKYNDEGAIASTPDYVTHYYWWSYPMRARGGPGRPGRMGYLYVAISFWREEDEDQPDQQWEGARAAKLYVGFSPTEIGNEISKYMVVNGSGRALDAMVLPPHVWAYFENGKDIAWSKRQFFFCVRLAQLESRDDLAREIVQPLNRLLSNPGILQEEAFAGTRACLRVPMSGDTK